jgi:hypothetical protein
MLMITSQWEEKKIVETESGAPQKEYDHEKAL